MAAKSAVVGRVAIPNKDDFKKYLSPLAEHFKNIANHEDISNFINASGHGNQDRTIRRLCSVVRDTGLTEFDFDDLDDDLSNIVGETEQLEVSLRELINEILSKNVGSDWCKGGMTDILPGKIENRLKESRKGDIERNPHVIRQGKLYIGLTLGLSKDLISMHWDKWFAKIFVVGGNKFTNKNQFDNALQHLELYRNSEFHGMLSEDERQIIKRPDQKKLAESYVKIFNSILQNLENSEAEEEHD